MQYKYIYQITLLLSVFFLFTFSKCDKDEDMDDDDDTMMEVTDTMMTDTNDTLRFAQFNASMFRSNTGSLIAELNTSTSVQIQKVAEIIQRVRPDVLSLMEFDYDANGEALALFQENYLGTSQNEADTIQYSYVYAVPSNTGLLSEADINEDGNINLPNDAYGFGNFEGQYAFAILSKYPLDLANNRTFQQFLWKDMPNALLPENPDGSAYYSEEATNVFRLSSKNHIDVPVKISAEKVVHVLLSHPTPPVFDGSEDRNGKRNFDEIRLWADYVSSATYLVDDNGQSGGLAADAHFVIMGDMNADPVDGDSVEEAIVQLLDHERVNQEVSTGLSTPSSEGGAEHNQASNHTGDPSYDTSFFGLRTDYVLPSNNFDIIESGVFWPSTSQEFSYLVEDEASSDHVLVWVDVAF